MPKLPNIHPGDVLREDFLEPLNRTAYWLAKRLGLSPTAIGEIMSCRGGVTAATALRLGHILGTSPEFWLNLQTAFDLEEARERLADELDHLTPIITCAGETH